MTILYCSTCPCLGCAKKIIQAGVVEVVYLEAYGMDEMTEALFIEAGVKMRQYKPVVDGVSGTFNNSNHFEASLTKMTLV